jgi:hypothetical protein
VQELDATENLTVKPCNKLPLYTATLGNCPLATSSSKNVYSPLIYSHNQQANVSEPKLFFIETKKIKL